MLYQGHYHPSINAIAGLRFAKSTIKWRAKTLRRSGGRNKAGGMGGVLISWYPLKRKRDGGKRGKTGNTERGLPAFAATTGSCRREQAQGLVVLHGALTLGVTRGGGTGRYMGWWHWALHGVVAMGAHTLVATPGQGRPGAAPTGLWLGVGLHREPAETKNCSKRQTMTIKLKCELSWTFGLYLGKTRQK